MPQTLNHDQIPECSGISQELHVDFLQTSSGVHREVMQPSRHKVCSVQCCVTSVVQEQVRGEHVSTVKSDLVGNHHVMVVLHQPQQHRILLSLTYMYIIWSHTPSTDQLILLVFTLPSVYTCSWAAPPGVVCQSIFPFISLVLVAYFIFQFLDTSPSAPTRTEPSRSLGMLYLCATYTCMHTCTCTLHSH